MTEKKSIGVFEAGPVPDEVVDQYPNYAQMIINWLMPALPDVEFKAYSPLRGEPLPPVDACDGYVYSGSRYGAYDDVEWIPSLESFIRSCGDANIPQFGICFGHQVMAQAFGGTVEKSERGWGCGIQHYHIDSASLSPLIKAARVNTDSADNQTLSVLLMHQDQITKLPPNARSIGGNDFCPFGALSYDGAALSVQFHPEFSSLYVSDLLRIRGGTVIPQQVATAATDTLTQLPDNTIIAEWVANFFVQHWRDEL